MVDGLTSGTAASIVMGVDGTITFHNARLRDKWLSGDSWLETIFRSQS